MGPGAGGGGAEGVEGAGGWVVAGDGVKGGRTGDEAPPLTASLYFFAAARRAAIASLGSLRAATERAPGPAAVRAGAPGPGGVGRAAGRVLGGAGRLGGGPCPGQQRPAVKCGQNEKGVCARVGVLRCEHTRGVRKPHGLEDQLDKYMCSCNSCPHASRPMPIVLAPHARCMVLNSRGCATYLMC